MPVVNVHRYAPSNSSGTIAVSGTLDVSSGVTVEMRNPPFSSAGTWTLFTFGTLVGSVSNITIVNLTGRPESNLRVSGTSILIDLA